MSAEPRDDDDPPLEKLSICAACCKHPVLKKFVKANEADGLACAVCIPVGGGATRACSVAMRPELMNLLAGLIRYYFDEFEYNGHWGADNSVEDLLTQQNPILEHENTLWNRRLSRDRARELLYHLFSENPYPEPGISVYAGFDSHGTRHLARSIGHTVSYDLRTLQARLTRENHFDIEGDVFKLIDALGSRLDWSVPAGARFFRARSVRRCGCTRRLPRG